MMAWAWLEDVPRSLVFLIGILGIGVTCFALIGVSAAVSRAKKWWMSKKYSLTFEEFGEHGPKSSTKRGNKRYVVVRNTGSQSIEDISVRIESIKAADPSQKYQDDAVTAVVGCILCAAEHDAPQSEDDLPVPETFDLGSGQLKQISVVHLWDKGKCYLLITKGRITRDSPFKWDRDERASVPPGKWWVELSACGKPNVSSIARVEIETGGDKPAFRNA